jgi:hypothetical protein
VWRVRFFTAESWFNPPRSFGSRDFYRSWEVGSSPGFSSLRASTFGGNLVHAWQACPSPCSLLPCCSAWGFLLMLLWRWRRPDYFQRKLDGKPS